MNHTGPRKLIKCARCNRRWRGNGNWNITVVRGYIQEHLCPTCQTAEENAEAEINFATLDYHSDGLGRLCGNPKTG